MKAKTNVFAVAVLFVLFFPCLIWRLGDRTCDGSAPGASILNIFFAIVHILYTAINGKIGMIHILELYSIGFAVTCFLVFYRKSIGGIWVDSKDFLADFFNKGKFVIISLLLVFTFFNHFYPEMVVIKADGIQDTTTFPLNVFNPVSAIDPILMRSALYVIFYGFVLFVFLMYRKSIRKAIADYAAILLLLLFPVISITPYNVSIGDICFPFQGKNQAILPLIDSFSVTVLSFFEHHANPQFDRLAGVTIYSVLMQITALFLFPLLLISKEYDYGQQ